MQPADLILACLRCANALKSEKKRSSCLNKIDHGVFEIPLKLPSQLETQREFYVAQIKSAQRRIVAFAREYGWQNLVAEPFAIETEIFAQQSDFFEALKNLPDFPPGASLPSTAVAALEDQRLMAVSCEEYKRICPLDDAPGAFEKLLAHEIAHRLHVRILSGNEEAMGPIWFFEGFATFAAGQYGNLELTGEEILQVIGESERGSYIKYNAALRFFLKWFSLKDMVDNIVRTDFISALEKYC